MTTIRVNGQEWRVPRGFGRVYRDVARDHFKHVDAGKPGVVIGMIVDLLALVGYTASASTIAKWDAQRRVEACVWAATEHARASDNPIHRHPQPAWLPAEPWKGPRRKRPRHIKPKLWGAFQGPSPTVIQA